jgi:hypothetical protein
MARCTQVKAARRRYSEDETGIEGGIKKGQSYYWWKFKRGGKHYSLTPPRASQLTQSAFYGTLYDIGDRIAALTADSDLPGEIESIAEDIRELGNECQSSLDNMPEGLQQGSTGEMLQERVDWCEEKAGEFEGIEAEYDAADHADDEDGGPDGDDVETQFWAEVLEEVQRIDLSSPN